MILNSSRKTQLTVGSSTHTLVLLGSTRKQTGTGFNASNGKIEAGKSQCVCDQSGLLHEFQDSQADSLQRETLFKANNN